MPELRKGGHKDLENFYNLMQMDFDSEELFSKLQIHLAITRGNAELLIMHDAESGMDLGYALVLPKSVYGYVLLKYMGVMPWYREKGVGVDFMRLLNRHFADRQGIVAEITDFPDSDPDHQRKLKKFFSRFGYTPVECEYRISGTDAHVYVKQIKGSSDVTPVMHRIIGDFYSRILSTAAMDKMIDIKKAEGKSEE